MSYCLTAGLRAASRLTRLDSTALGPAAGVHVMDTIIEYLREENRVLREQLGGRRVRFNDDQRRRLASKAKGLGRKLLREVATLVTPETLLA